MGKSVADEYPTSAAILEIKAFFLQLQGYISDIPPLKQPMRFGNKAFRTWHQKLTLESPIFLSNLLKHSDVSSTDSRRFDDLVKELSAYLTASFGNEVRIDYGTGHELNLIVFLFCLIELKVLTLDDIAAAVLQVFVTYVQVMRRLQESYMLEPAGSHGVWGLDDYHCLTFLFGAAQLHGSSHPEITPQSIHNETILAKYQREYLYLEGIAFIRRIKSSAPFAETSPMLNDISGLADWSRVTAGLLRLFQGEVLFKRPVVQHLPFGSIFKCTWVPTEASTSSATGHTKVDASGSYSTASIRPGVMRSSSIGGIMPIHHSAPSHATSGTQGRPHSERSASKMSEFMNTPAPWANK